MFKKALALGIAASLSAVFAMAGCSRAKCNWGDNRSELAAFSDLADSSLTCGVVLKKDHYDFNATQEERDRECTKIGQAACDTALVLSFPLASEADLSGRIVAAYQKAGFALDPDLKTSSGGNVQRRNNVASYWNSTKLADRVVVNVTFQNLPKK